jgi:FAD/FMN-containing dehydrogenase
VARVAFRLHPKPAVAATLAIPYRTPAEAERHARHMLRSQYVLSAVDIIHVSRASPGRLPGDSETPLGRLGVLALLFEGGERAVRGQVEAVRGELGGEEDASIWDAIAERQLGSGGRVSFDPGRLAGFLAETDAAVVRVAAGSAYVADAPPADWSPLALRVEAEFAR